MKYQNLLFITQAQWSRRKIQIKLSRQISVFYKGQLYCFFIVLSNIYATDCRTLDAVCFQAMDGKLMVNSLDYLIYKDYNRSTINPFTCILIYAN